MKTKHKYLNEAHRRNEEGVMKILSMQRPRSLKEVMEQYDRIHGTNHGKHQKDLNGKPQEKE